MKNKLPLSLPKLQKKADQLFSLKIRKSSANGDMYAECITCERFYPWKNLDAGHFIQREHLAVRYHKDNVWPQCRKCNRFKGGRHSVYRDQLIKIIGKERVEELEKKKYETVVFARSLYEKVIEECGSPPPGHEP